MENIYVCETRLEKNPIPYESKDLECFDKMLISKGILFKKTAIMHGKGEFSKIKRTLCNAILLPKPTDSTTLIVIRLKRNLRRRG